MWVGLKSKIDKVHQQAKAHPHLPVTYFHSLLTLLDEHQLLQRVYSQNVDGLRRFATSMLFQPAGSRETRHPSTSTTLSGPLEDGYFRFTARLTPFCAQRVEQLSLRPYKVSLPKFYSVETCLCVQNVLSNLVSLSQPAQPPSGVTALTFPLHAAPQAKTVTGTGKTTTLRVPKSALAPTTSEI